MRDRLDLSAQTINDVVFHAVSTYGLISQVKGLLSRELGLLNIPLSPRGTTLPPRCNFFLLDSWTRKKKGKKGVLAMRETKGRCGVDPYPSHPPDNLFHSKNVTRSRLVVSSPVDDHEKAEVTTIIPKGRPVCMYLNSRSNYRFCY